MKKYHGWKILIATIVMLGASTFCNAGSDRLIMGMTMKNMNRLNLVYVKLIGPKSEAIEFNQLTQVEIREQDCNSGHLFKMTKDYRAGYYPKGLLIGIYLSPYAWRNRTLCFSVPGIGKVEQKLDPIANKGRSFHLQLAD